MISIGNMGHELLKKLAEGMPLRTQTHSRRRTALQSTFVSLQSGEIKDRKSMFMRLGVFLQLDKPVGAKHAGRVFWDFVNNPRGFQEGLVAKRKFIKVKASINDPLFIQVVTEIIEVRARHKNPIDASVIYRCVQTYRPALAPKTNPRQIRRLLNRLGRRFQRPTKDVFIDVHERPDVVEHRNKHVGTVVEESPRLVDPGVNKDDQKIVYIYMDESTFNGQRHGYGHYVADGELPPNKTEKSGAGLMVCGFICACHGFMNLRGDGVQPTHADAQPLTDEYASLPAELPADGKLPPPQKFAESQLKARFISPLDTAIICEGTSFNNDLLLAQLRRVAQVSAKLHPDKKLVFFFDNARLHTKGEGGRNIQQYPKKPSERKNLLEEAPGWFGNPRREQTFVRNGEFIGTLAILQERGYKFDPQKTPGAPQLRSMLSQEPDMLESRQSLVDLRLEEVLGDSIEWEVRLLPKAHPELNPIERVWSWMKRQSLVEVQDFESAELGDERRYLTAINRSRSHVRSRMLEILCSVPLDHIQNYCSHALTLCFMYASNLSYTLAVRASHKFKSHRATLTERQHQMVLAEQKEHYLKLIAAGCAQAGVPEPVVDEAKRMEIDEESEQLEDDEEMAGDGISDGESEDNDSPSDEDGEGWGVEE